LDKTIITALLIIAGVVCVVLIFNTLYPAIVQSSEAMVGMERRIDERLQSQIEIIHAVPDGVVTKRALVWVKNVGSITIKPVDGCDVFFGPEGGFTRIPYGVEGAHWEYIVENEADNSWKPTATVKISIDVNDNLADGTRYFVKIVTPGGIEDELYFSK
jgi:hypothetical protein